MRRRMDHWSSQGFISQLRRVSEIALRGVVQPAVSPLQNDISLARLLVKIEDRNTFHAIVEHTSTNSPLTITSLFTACRNMPTLPRPVRREQSEETSGLYHKDTCVEFHQLLVSALLSFWKALKKLELVKGDYRKTPDLAELVRCAKRVCSCGNLLWSIAYSRALEDHLKVLQAQGWLELPETQPAFVDDASADTAGNDDEKGEGGQVENQEYNKLVDQVESSDDEALAVVFLEWIRLQVDRFQAARKITSYVKRNQTPSIDVNLLAVRHPGPRAASVVLEPWRDTIKRLYPTTGNPGRVSADEVICRLDKTISRALKKPKSKNTIFGKFGDTYKYEATVHCEAALAAIAKFPEGVICKDGHGLCDHIHESVIAVSKCCCPVCWELLKIMGSEDNFHVEGYHKSLFQLELPDWLPEKIVARLTIRFEDILKQQITNFMGRYKRHNRTPSAQSGDGFSSDSSVGEDDVVDAQDFEFDD